MKFKKEHWYRIKKKTVAERSVSKQFCCTAQPPRHAAWSSSWSRSPFAGWEGFSLPLFDIMCERTDVLIKHKQNLGPCHTFQPYLWQVQQNHRRYRQGNIITRTAIKQLPLTNNFTVSQEGHSHPPNGQSCLFKREHCAKTPHQLAWETHAHKQKPTFFLSFWTPTDLPHAIPTCAQVN